MGKNSSDLAESTFSRDLLGEKFVEALESAASEL
jgi:hypothetical protein